jgi:limonene-1,2-epoxide hydrolase
VVTVGRHTELVEAFIEAWQARDIERIVAFLAPDIRYHNMPGEPIDGLPATRAALQGLLDRVSDLRWDIRHVAEAPDGTVLYEKTEHYLIGETWVALPCMIALEFTDDLISHWRAYFDVATWTKQVRRD